MGKKKNVIYIAICLLFVLAGCSGGVSKEKETFKGQGSTFKMSLPKGWVKDKDYQTRHGANAVYGAEDKKSNSFMYVSVTPVDEVEKKGFGDKNKKDLQSLYGLKNEKSIYIEEIKINDSPAYTYTLKSIYKDKKVWTHLYYTWTEHGFVQIVYYSADDNNYKKRYEWIDEAVKTLKETNYDEEEAKVEKEKNKVDVRIVQNSQMKVEITAVRPLEFEKNIKVMAIRYSFTNLSEQMLKPSKFSTLVNAKQDNQSLEVVELPKETSLLDVNELVENGEKDVKKGEQIESVMFYQLNSDADVTLEFSQSDFPKESVETIVVPK
ncbi:DUF5067 domain-containing protein [Enterococcus rotai]|uniref:DUF5067 domain-containing protein n=1 Tax=Enterococcus rotai TaxID=118060 RepID=UPI0032B480CA